MTDIINIHGVAEIIIKISAILISLFYLIFAFVISKHLKSLKKTIDINDKGWLYLVSYIQLMIGIILVTYSLFVL
ncbi:hypothetical protein A3C23_03980 [Candidatus Roizmanbacteria bacterium RIFCSPHIGHO2_02_FULL_37_13b]|uniref:Uncharacterized protein n=1 Tax=Candidatus Roizmanbacteria bacterium RIFCSPLOWO2_02_FULL_36_11 TaxID=1802071 RepID=A0A1F7JGY7_9BACT|nr:MAG: hypothetical protein A3C23_03980 [Candidatus Roizmanbacteria bacterium RIFCSPHIGHO2_02_FULL_37_13b]OGK54878.1 MAG: hypothetical protein A3H78_00130 [Candidatus Roizmanbacteria bacterium RIFCSPLOWO2_02_FULL_36_11]